MKDGDEEGRKKDFGVSQISHVGFFNWSLLVLLLISVLPAAKFWCSCAWLRRRHFKNKDFKTAVVTDRN
jgi:hypothetical protein